MLPIAFSPLLDSCVERREFTYPAKDEVVARVDGEEVMKNEFELLLPKDAEFEMTAEERHAYLESWITTELLYREAVRSGLGEDEEIRARLLQVKKDLIADRLVQRVVQERAVVSEAEVRAYYERHKREYTNEFSVSHVLVATMEEAVMVKERLKHEPFDRVARMYSLDKDSRHGGDLGFLSKGNMMPEFEDAVFRMAVGDVSDIIESEFGYHVITLRDIRPAKQEVSFEDFKEEIAGRLMMKKRTAVYDSLVAALRSSRNVQILDQELMAIMDGEEPDTLPASFGFSMEEPDSFAVEEPDTFE
ncbi:MAG: peptidylprolyl isomerase [Chitinivibrionia bacterium]|nr:peptidylprolyl isomerase [Chitinivibrionia bacterium]